MSALRLKQLEDMKKSMNHGCENASKSLSKIMEAEVKLSVSEVKLMKIEDITKKLGKTEEIMTVVLLNLYGDITGTTFLILEPESALKIAAKLTKIPKKDIRVFDEFDISALSELGNITMGAIISALSDHLDKDISLTIPETVTDMLGSTVNSIIAHVGKSTDKILIHKININIAGNDIKGNLLFFFDPKASESIIKIKTKTKTNAGNDKRGNG
ncbi:hypothetical protein GF354_01080 [Candidatus Peregrinibacteria bacterium]|nr:hypothetical protein [Candidatus Peregrinibacteria bacterium]